MGSIGGEARKTLERRRSIGAPAAAAKELDRPLKTLHRYRSDSFSVAIGEEIQAAADVDDGGSSERSLSYTSLRDVLQSLPRTPPSLTGSEISIRNHLVKQAAWAYLQPMAPSPYSPGPRGLLRRSSHFLRSVCADLVWRHLLPLLSRAFGCLCTSFCIEWPAPKR